MKYTLSALLLLFLVSLKIALIAGPPADFRHDRHEFEPRLSGEILPPLPRTEGSPYFIEDWLSGDVRLTNGQWVTAQQLRYNGFLDELIWMHPRQFVPVRVDKNLVDRFVLYQENPADTFHFVNIRINLWYESRMLNVFAQELYTGKSQLVVHRNIRQMGERVVQDGGQLFTRPRIEPDPGYYLIGPDGRAQPIRGINRRALLSVFSERRSEIRQALRQHHIRLRSEEDLARAIAVIDQLNP